MSDDHDGIERLRKAPARYVFYVDVGKMSPEKAQEFLREAKHRIKGNPFDTDEDEFID